MSRSRPGSSTLTTLTTTAALAGGLFAAAPALAEPVPISATVELICTSAGVKPAKVTLAVTGTAPDLVVDDRPIAFGNLDATVRSSGGYITADFRRYEPNRINATLSSIDLALDGATSASASALSGSRAFSALRYGRGGTFTLPAVGLTPVVTPAPESERVTVGLGQVRLSGTAYYDGANGYPAPGTPVGNDGDPNARVPITLDCVGTPGVSTIATVDHVPAAPASLAGLSPKSIGPGSATPITITGTSLSAATAVTFGGTPAASFRVIDDRTIEAIPPSLFPALYPVQVLIDGTPVPTVGDELVLDVIGFGPSLPLLPTVSLVAPGLAKVGVGGLHYLLGTRLTSMKTIRVGTRSVKPLAVLNQKFAVFQSPALAAGTYPVSVVARDGRTVSTTSTITYR